jgi:hypothetical protein
MALAVLPALSPALLIDYLPKVVRLTSSDLGVRAEPDGQRSRRVQVDTPGLQPIPDFMAGAIEQASRGVKAEVLERRPDGYCLRLSW